METAKKYTANIREFVKAHSLGILVLGGILTLLVGSIAFFYVASRNNTLVQSTVKHFPYPIVWVNGDFVTERELAKNMDSVRRFYENQDFSSLGLRVDLSSEEGQKRLKVREREVLNKMVEDAAFRAIAGKKNITITEQEVKDDIRTRIESYGTGSEVEKNLERLYGWNIQDFAEKVVSPALYQERLQAVYKEEVDQKNAREKVEAAEKELSGGASFVDVARKYSEGNTSQNGGELGWFQLMDLTPELQEQVRTAPLGQVSPIVESSLGYHIVLVEETKNDGEVTLYRLSQIFAKKISFSTWLTQEMQALHISVWSPFYIWNEERAQVDFKEESWQQFEQAVYENSTEDALFVN